MEIVLQDPLFPGGYVSELIDGRYQVVESKLMGAFSIFDHKSEILLRSKKGDVIETWPTANAARHFIGAGAIVEKKKKGQRIAGTKAPAYVKKGRKESALSYMKELLKSNIVQTDQTVADMVKKKFPDSNYNASMVKFNRKKLAKG